jgi:hypothetical protein
VSAIAALPYGAPEAVATGLRDAVEWNAANTAAAHQRLDENAAVLSLSKEFGERVQEYIPELETLGFLQDADGEPRAALTLLFVELIRDRLIERIPEMASFAEALGIVIHDAFGFWTGWKDETSPPRKATRKRRKPKRPGDNRLPNATT